MANYNNNGRDIVPVWLVVVGFCIGFWPGAILLGIRIWQTDNAKKNSAQAYRSDSEWARNAQDVSYRNAQEPRIYRPATEAQRDAQGGALGGTQQNGANYHYDLNAGKTKDEPQATGYTKADGTYAYRYSYGKTAPSASSGTYQARKNSLLDHYKLNPSIGKGLRTAGLITLVSGAAIAALALFGSWLDGEFLDGIIGSFAVAMSICLPGGIMAGIGTKKRERIMRCRNYAAMIGDQQTVDIDDLAAAVPTTYKKCCEDLKWMLGEGMLKGMYIDGTHRTLTYPNAKPAPTRTQTETKAAVANDPTRPAKNAKGEKIYDEEWRIHQLNVDIQDDYVSTKMERLEELTHKILAYAEKHPEKEPALRQFRNHYLPKTFSILESYARMERTGVDGGNIASAMQDVEDIMEKLVAGFEKQLDTIFAGEAMDVSTDINVLENMMKMEGLNDLDPFGSLKKDDDLLRR